MGVYLGRSPHHNRNVALILNRETGLVSPQYHVMYNNEFRTVTNDDYDSLWKIKAGFVTNTQAKDDNSLSTKGLVPNSMGNNNAKELLPSEGGRDLNMPDNVRKRRLTIDKSTNQHMHANKKDKNESPKPKRVSWDQTTTNLKSQRVTEVW